MLAYGDHEGNEQLDALKLSSGRLYPEFVHEVEDESGMRVDFRREGTISFFPDGESPACSSRELSAQELEKWEPAVSFVGISGGHAGHVVLTPEETVDNRALAAALLQTARHRGIDVSSGSEVTEIVTEKGRAAGIRTSRTDFRATIVVNCAGAWAGQLDPSRIPIVPRKGQALTVISANRQLLRHAVRGHDVYLVPRSDGRIIIGATVEDAGYDKRVDPDTIQRLHQSAANLVPEIGQLRMHEAWAGLRPATVDKLPVIGGSSLPGLFVATAHFRNGILLAPITARIIGQVIRGAQPECCIDAFSPARFKN
jgi:glycine/D-amino acid oxidase-like deaminating enzyme